MIYSKRQTKKEILEGVSGIKNTKIIANNTVRIEFEDGTIAIRLHNTNVVTTHPNGDITLNTGGWQTLTTKERITTYSPFRIRQEKGVWTVITSAGSYDFYDGITFRDSVPLEVRHTDTKGIAQLKKRITKFAALITEDNIPMPNGGDCWCCSMHTAEGKTMGELGDDTGHLLSHIDEGYMHGSLIVNAMRAKGYADRQIGLHLHMKLVDTLRRAVRAYLQKKLISNISVKGRTV